MGLKADTQTHSFGQFSPSFLHAYTQIAKMSIQEKKANSVTLVPGPYPCIVLQRNSQHKKAAQAATYNATLALI